VEGLASSQIALVGKESEKADVQKGVAGIIAQLIRYSVEYGIPYVSCCDGQSLLILDLSTLLETGQPQDHLEYRIQWALMSLNDQPRLVLAFLYGCRPGLFVRR
jgi:hypothetical protein